MRGLVFGVYDAISTRYVQVFCAANAAEAERTVKLNFRDHRGIMTESLVLELIIDAGFSFGETDDETQVYEYSRRMVDTILGPVPPVDKGVPR